MKAACIRIYTLPETQVLLTYTYNQINSEHKDLLVSSATPMVDSKSSTVLWILILQVSLHFCNSWEIPKLPLEDERSMRDRYEKWISVTGRLYKDFAEKEQRFQIYLSNVQLIATFNSLSLGYNLIDNKFADLTNEEFRAKIDCLGPPHKPKYKSPESTKFQEKLVLNRPKASIKEKSAGITEDPVPPSIDWRKKGAVTDVKDQGQCGACWAFSAVAAIEGINQIKTQKLISLSEQELLDCDNGVNDGCNGGYMNPAFDFVHNHGLTTEDNYPYEGSQGSCQTLKEHESSASISGYRNVTVNNEHSLLQTVAKQPVSVAIDAGGFTFQFYSEGVFSGPCGSDLNHGVTVVGYGASHGNENKEEHDKYWIIKNSWGDNWGEEGYIKMRRDVTPAEGLCGIAMMPSYPVIDEDSP